MVLPTPRPDGSVAVHADPKRRLIVAACSAAVAALSLAWAAFPGDPAVADAAGQSSSRLPALVVGGLGVLVAAVCGIGWLQARSGPAVVVRRDGIRARRWRGQLAWSDVRRMEVQRRRTPEGWTFDEVLLLELHDGSQRRIDLVPLKEDLVAAVTWGSGTRPSAGTIRQA